MGVVDGKGVGVGGDGLGGAFGRLDGRSESWVGRVRQGRGEGSVEAVRVVVRGSGGLDVLFDITWVFECSVYSHVDLLMSFVSALIASLWSMATWALDFAG